MKPRRYKIIDPDGVYLQEFDSLEEAQESIYWHIKAYIEWGYALSPTIKDFIDYLEKSKQFCIMYDEPRKKIVYTYDNYFDSPIED